MRTLIVAVFATMLACSRPATTTSGGHQGLPAASVSVIPQTNPGSHCPGYADVYLQNNSPRTISVEVKRSDNVDDQTTVSTYTLDPSHQQRGSWLPWVNGPRVPSVFIGCQTEGAKTYTYTVIRTDYQ